MWKQSKIPYFCFSSHSKLSKKKYQGIWHIVIKYELFFLNTDTQTKFGRSGAFPTRLTERRGWGSMDISTFAWSESACSYLGHAYPKRQGVNVLRGNKGCLSEGLWRRSFFVERWQGKNKNPSKSCYQLHWSRIIWWGSRLNWDPSIKKCHMLKQRPWDMRLIKKKHSLKTAQGWKIIK